MDFKSIINAALKFLEKRILSAATTVTKSIDGLRGTIATNSEAERKEMQKFGGHLKALSERIENPKFDVNVDMGEVVECLGEMKNILLFMNEKSVDLSTVEQLLGALIETFKQGHPDAFAEKIDALDAVFKGIKIPETIGFDPKQMKGLMTALTNAGGGSITTGGGVLAARNVDVDNVAMTDANTQYSYTFPANTVGFELRLRADDVPLLVAYTTGKLPTSGDGLAYLTVPAYFIEKTAGLDWSGKTIYVQTGSASQTLEVITYTA